MTSLYVNTVIIYNYVISSLGIRAFDYPRIAKLAKTADNEGNMMNSYKIRPKTWI